MTPQGAPTPVENRWQRPGEGAHYAAGRFRSKRARERDPRLVARLIRSLAGQGGSVASILDVPCGTGRLRGGTMTAVGTGGVLPNWTGVDVSHEMLTQVNAEGAALVRASADALPFPDRSFDLVLCCRLLHHLPEAGQRRAVLAELARVGQRYVIASYWDASSYQAWRRRTKGVLRRKGRAETRRAVEWDVLCGEIEECGMRVLGRAHSLRFVSQQAFFVAEILG